MSFRKTRKGGKKCGFFGKMFKSKHCKHHHHKGGSLSKQGINNWLWSVSNVSNNTAVHSKQHTNTAKETPSPPVKQHKGGRKTRRAKGGLSSQLVPFGLLAGVLASRKKRRYRKGQKSKTRKGRLDFETHKGDKLYNRNNKRQSFNQLGVRRRPF